jgi:MarR family transcriptional regulator for hemolysin
MSIPTYLISSLQTKAYRLLRTRVYDVLTKYDLTPTYWSMLGIVMQSPDGIRHAEIARELHVKPPLITIMARQLQERGLIRGEQNQFDARAKLLVITPKGKTQVSTIETELRKMLEQLLSGVSDADMTAYHKVLTTIIANDMLMLKQG